MSDDRGKKSMEPDDDGLVYGPLDAAGWALSALQDFVVESREVRASGAEYLASRHDPEQRSVVLYFRHPDRVPPIIAAEADRLAVSFTLIAWPYSLDEVKAASLRLTEAFSTEPGRIELPDGFRVSRVMLWDGKFAGLRPRGSYRDGRTTVPSASVVAEVSEIAGVPVQINYEEVQVDDSPAQRAIPDGLETFTVSAGVGFRPEHRLIRRDERRLLWALGEVERDLQGTLGWQWTLAMRSSLSVIAQYDGDGRDAIGSISPGLDPARLPAGALEPDRLEATLMIDALDSVGEATHILLSQRDVHWPVCLEHPQAHVAAHQGRWVCPTDNHDVGQLGHLAPVRKKRLRRDGTVEFLDDEPD
jgi:hypothetical protein